VRKGVKENYPQDCFREPSSERIDTHGTMAGLNRTTCLRDLTNKKAEERPAKRKEFKRPGMEDQITTK